MLLWMKDVAVVMITLMTTMNAAVVTENDSTSPATPTLHATTTVSVKTQHHNLFQRVDLVSLDQLIMFSGMVEPYSCWCTDSHNSCPVSIPAALLHQVLKVTCGNLKIHCCLERVEDHRQEDSLLAASNNITTLQELGSFLDSVIDILKPQEEILIENAIGDSQVSHQRDSHNPNYPNSQQTMKGTLDHKRNVVTGRLNSDSLMKRPAYSIEDGVILAMKTMAELLMAHSAQSLIQAQPHEDSNPASFQENKLQNSNILSGIGNNITAGVQKNQLTNNYNISNDVNVKSDFLVPYSNLGWLSKVVEVAMDGSIYIGLILTLMFFTANILTGAFSIFGETCLICAILGYMNEADIS